MATLLKGTGRQGAVIGELVMWGKDLSRYQTRHRQLYRLLGDVWFLWNHTVCVPFRELYMKQLETYYNAADVTK